MQASATLRLGGSSVARAAGARGFTRPRAGFPPALVTSVLDPRWTRVDAGVGGGVSSVEIASRQFGSKAAAAPPVHATPHYMDYDTLVDMHLITRQSFGNRPLFGTKGDGKGATFEWLTYKDFGKQVDRCRAALAGLGVGRGDTVGIISNNRAEWAVCAYATYSLGGVFVPMYEEQVRSLAPVFAFSLFGVPFFQICFCVCVCVFYRTERVKNFLLFCCLYRLISYPVWPTW